MTDLFLKIVNMSISASWLVLAVIVLRLILRKSPKWIHVLLWGMVAFRLICPFSIESTFSLVPSTETISPQIMMEREPKIDTGFTVLNEAVNPVIKETFAPEPAASANPLQILMPVASVIWLAGIAALLLYTAISYVLLKRKISTAVLLRYNVFQSEYVTTPFVLGILKPKIYLPYTMSQTEIIHVISHEKAHIRRHDHWWKPLGFLLVSVYWFNPVMWLAYKLLCKDIELACDENVIRNMNNDQRADYAQALLSCSVKPRLVSACPIAFGEVGVKTRIKSVLNYKKPAFWLILVAVLTCIVLAVCFLTDPKTENTSAQETVNDFSYHLELVVPGKIYRDMDERKKTEILSEYGDLLDDYTLIARESTDGSVSYIGGYFDGPIEENPLRDIGSFTGEDFIQVLHSQSDGMEEPAPQLPAYTLHKSNIWYSQNVPFILIEAKNVETTLTFAYWRYVDADLGGAYIQDAVSRGVTLYGAEPFLAIDTTLEKWGRVSERIALTDEDVEHILAEERMFTGVGQDFRATLIYGNGEKMEVFWEDVGVPPTVFDLAVNITGYSAPENMPAPEPTESVNDGQEEVRDLAYFMELAAPGKEFQDMSLEKRAEIIPEYGGLLDGYDLIARESTDGSLAYIVGCWGGNVEESPLYHLLSSSRGDENGEVQVLYDERDLEAADKYEEPEYKYVIHNSHINNASKTGYFLIHPTDSGWGFNDVFNKYLRPNGREYMQDAFSRGISLSTPEGAYLEVSLISPQWGEIYEMIPLSEEQVSKIIAEDRQKIETGHGFAARLEPGPNSALNLDWDALYYTEFRGVPQTVLNLAVEKCGYTFATPADIQSPIVEAKLDCSWLEEPIYAEESDLPRLKSILENAEFGYIGKCGYGAKLTISMEDGREMIMFKGTDSCDTIVFGSYGGYFIGDGENTEFWDMFGIDIGAAWRE